MRIIDIRPYDITINDKSLKFDVRNSLVGLLFQGNIPPREFVDRDKLAKRIESADDGIFMFEEQEWKWLQAGLEACKSSDLGRNSTELIRRIYFAEQPSDKKE